MDFSWFKVAREFRPCSATNFIVLIYYNIPWNTVLKKSKLHAVLKWKCKFKYDNNWAMVVLLYPILDILVSRNRIFWLNCYWNWVEFSCVAWHFVILINVEIENKLQILKLPFQFKEKYCNCNPFFQKILVMLFIYHAAIAICSWLSYFSAVARSIISQ